jgi:LIVCS family branched-chain amino acid:cation transporter
MLTGGAVTELAIFSVIFFALVLFFSLRPSKILTWVGRIINPLFLVFLAVLVVTALVKPVAAVSSVSPEGAYASSAFSAGFLDGYNTMDALASLAFGVIVVGVIRDLGIKHDAAVAGNTVRAGVFSCVFMGLIYLAMTIIGAQSRGAFAVSANGGIALADIAGYYFGTAGQVILAVTVTLACLKTAIGLVTSCAEIFRVLFPKSMSYKAWAIVFSVVSLLITNVGLTQIIEYSVPVLMFLYPLTITLMLLSLFGHFFDYDKRVFVSVTAFTLAAAVLDLLAALPDGARAFLHVNGFVAFCKESLPLFGIGLFWLIPAVVGLVIGFILRAAGKKATA